MTRDSGWTGGSIALSGWIALLALPACISWESGWEGGSARPAPGDVSRLLGSAEAKAALADSREKLLAAIAAYEAVLRVDPRHRGALSRLAEYHLLAGTGYSERSSDKERHFRASIRASERAMYLNPRFRRLVDEGESVWDASAVLTAREADAMGWWSTAVFYYFKEGVPDLLKLFNVRWIKRTRKVMARLERVAPDWNGGAGYFNWGIYYLAIPESLGGDMARSADYFDRARRAAGPDRLLVPWGRAKYFHVKRGDREAFERELRWVAAQDPRASTGDPYPWNVYFQREARQLLASADAIF